MELALLLSLVAFLGGLWVYLFGVITNMTVNSIADSSLIVLGLAHWTIFCYLALALYVFYETGRVLRSKKDISETAVKAERILLQTWHYTLVALAVGLIVVRLGETNFWLKLPLVILAVAGLAAIPARHLKKMRLDPSEDLSISTTFMVLVAIAGSYIPYLFFMSTVMADVQITTDKQIYAAGDTILVSVRRAGYVIGPELKNIEFGAFRRTLISDTTFSVSPRDRASQNIINVESTPEMSFLNRTAYIEVNAVNETAK
jgi:hypothetical protein